jgi:hypothetical protein
MNINTSIHNVKRVEMTDASQLTENTTVREMFIVDSDNNIITLTLFSRSGSDGLEIKHNAGSIVDVFIE